MSTFSNLYKRVPLIAAIILLLLLRPYFAWTFIDNSFVKTGLLVLLSLLFFLRKKSGITIKEFLYITVFFLAVSCYCFFAIMNGRVNANGFINSLTCFLLVSIPLCKRSFGIEVYETFANLFALVVGLSLGSWIIFSTVGLPQLGIIEYVSQHRQYLHYPFFVIEINDSTLDVLRFSGPFDEPGVVGTYGALILAVSKYSFRIKRNIVIFVAGLFSFSLFFYIVSFVYLLYYYIAVKRQVVVSILLVASMVAFYYGTKDNPIFYEYIWKRIEWDSSNSTIAGDNRSNDGVDGYLEFIRGKYEYYTGTTDSNWIITVAGSQTSTYKSIICIHGIIFFVLYLSFFVLLGIIHKKNKWEFILYIIVVIANFYQRPSVLSPVPVFLYCAFAFGYLNFERLEANENTTQIIKVNN